MKLAGIGKLFAVLYDDRMDVYRTRKDENSDTTTDIFYNPTPYLENIKCRISFKSDGTGVDKEVDMNPVRFSPKIFCAQDVDLQAGDYVVVKRYSDDGRIVKTYMGTLSAPSWYSSHQEAFLRIDEGA